MVRIVFVYLVAATVSTVLLVLIDRWPILDDPGVAIRRTVIVTFPAVFAATIVDNLR